MRYIIIVMIILLTMSGKDIINVTTGSLEMALMKSENGYVKSTDLIINNDTYREHDKFTVALGVQLSEGNLYNTTVKSNVGNVNLYRFNELYYSRYLGSGVSFSVGLFPFKNGRFYEYSNTGHRKGIGIYMLTDATMQGIIFTKKFKDSKIQIGDVAYERFFKSYVDYEKGSGEITLDSHKDSSFKYISYSRDKNNIYTNIVLGKISQYLNGRNILDTDTATFEVSYDDEVNSGRVYYGLATYSRTQGDTAGIIKGVGRYSDSKTRFDTVNTSGMFYLIGVKQELDSIIFKRDVLLGVEYMYREPGTHSLLAGQPLSKLSYSDIGATKTAYVGVRVDKDKLIKLKYCKYESKGMATKGLFTTEYTSDYGEDLSNESLMLELYIDF